VDPGYFRGASDSEMTVWARARYCDGYEDAGAGGCVEMIALMWARCWANCLSAGGDVGMIVLTWARACPRLEDPSFHGNDVGGNFTLGKPTSLAPIYNKAPGGQPAIHLRANNKKGA
jgi:hypothetical protein